MGDIRDRFPSKYLKSSDLGDRQVRVYMEKVIDEEVGEEKELKPVLYLQGKIKGLVLNITNVNAIGDAYGFDEEQWFGKPIVLYVDKNVMYKGKRQEGIRVMVPKLPASKRHAAKPTKESEDPGAGMTTAEIIDDDIPDF